mgnify:CR=1 FL=1
MYSCGNAITEIPMPFRKTENQLKDYIFILFLVVGIPYIIGQAIYEQWGVFGCLVPLLGCGGLVGLILSGAFAFKEDNGDTKISFDPPARDKKSHEMAVSMVREMVGKQIRLVSVHWSDPGREEYLYSPDIEHSDKRREVFSWINEPTDDILSKSRYMVESIEGEEDQIRLASVQWSNLERYEYLITSRHTSRLDRRDIYSWKGESTNDILSKSRYRVEFVNSSKEEETEEENWWGSESVPRD